MTLKSTGWRVARRISVTESCAPVIFAFALGYLLGINSMSAIGKDCVNNPGFVRGIPGA
jgi:hypothetical protein